MEKLVNGTLVGPTFLCILRHQFHRIRIGDRFFYENAENGFTEEQLNEIRKSSVSLVMCTNVKSMKAAQPRGFQTISKE